jgi:transposase
MSTITTYCLFVGIDVAGATFTASWADKHGAERARPITLAQTPEGFAALQQHLQATGVAPQATLVVLEATGSYWIALAVFLHQAGYHVSVVNPAHTHNYAKSLPRRSKTDLLDAELLTQFAAERQPAPWTPPPAVYHELRQRLVARDALLAMRQQARNHRHALLQWPVVVASVQAQLDETIADLDRRIRTLEDELAHVLEQGAWADEARLLQTIPGIGLLTAAWLLVLTINFSLCRSAAAAAAYAGLVPLDYRSGTSVHRRATIGHGGNARLRHVAYLATLSAARHNPTIQAFYQRLRAAGKPMKVARCAAARKLLGIAWAVVTKQQPFEPIAQAELSADQAAKLSEPAMRTADASTPGQGRAGASDEAAREAPPLDGPSRARLGLDQRGRLGRPAAARPQQA